MHPSRSAPRGRTGIHIAPSPKRTKKGKKRLGGLNPISWDRIFETRQELTLEDWNKSYVESPYFAREDDESLIRAFMMDRNELEDCQPQADKVDKFCGKEGLADCPEDHPVMMIDDRSGEPGNEGSRAYLGPLTPRMALEELQKPRFRTQSVKTSSAPGEPSSGPPGEGEQVDAERRRIFITDLDRWSIHVLIATASLHQEYALRAAIFRHLGFEPQIGIEYSTEGLRTFQLSFHLPYYAWCTFEKSRPPKDDRQSCSDGHSLRRCRDLSFLGPSNGESSDYLCEAQISCVITGPDQWRWVAYCFVDAYFAQEGKESVSQYHDDSLGEYGLRTDPLTLGNKEADRPIQNPREYFLMVFRIRFKQVWCEWQQVVEKLKEAVNTFEETTLPDLKDFVSPTEAENNLKRVYQAGNWLRHMRPLIRILVRGLSKTYTACQDFYQNDTSIFGELSEAASTSHESLPAIRVTYNDLKSLERILESLSARCDHLVRDLELYHTQEASQLNSRQCRFAQQALDTSYLHGELAQQNNELARQNSELSNKFANDSRRVSTFMVVFVSPLALTASIFSMQGPIIPFLPPTLASFLGLTSFFVFIGIIIILLQYYGSELSAFATRFTKTSRFNRCGQTQESARSQQLPTMLEPVIGA